MWKNYCCWVLLQLIITWMCHPRCKPYLVKKTKIKSLSRRLLSKQAAHRDVYIYVVCHAATAFFLQGQIVDNERRAAASRMTCFFARIIMLRMGITRFPQWWCWKAAVVWLHSKSAFVAFFLLFLPSFSHFTFAALSFFHPPWQTMIYDDNFSEKKRQKNILAFLQNGKYHFLNSMGYQPSATSHSKRGR